MNEEQMARSTENVGDDRLMRGSLQRDKDAVEGRPRNRRKKKVSYLTINKIDHVDYKEINILRRFLNDRGKLLPARQSGNTASQQRMIAVAVRRAREMALLPYVVDESAPDRGGFARRERAPRSDRSDYERNSDSSNYSSNENSSE